MKLFSGKLVVLVKTTREAGRIRLKVTGKDLKTGKLELEAFEKK
jgi:beta-galactosidase